MADEGMPRRRGFGGRGRHHRRGGHPQDRRGPPGPARPEGLPVDDDFDGNVYQPSAHQPHPGPREGGMPVTDGSQPPHDPGHGMPSDDPNAPPPVERPRGTAKVLKLFEMQPLSVPELHQIAES